MAARKITLYVDTVSPFAYIAYYVLRHDAVFAKCDVTYVPVFLGGLMRDCGNTPPLNIKNKNRWIERERLRWAKAFAVPINPEIPPGFPPLTLGIMRCLSALRELDGSNQTRLIRALDALFSALFTRHEETHRPEVLSRVLAQALGGEEAARLVMEAGSAADVGKAVLKRNTDEAFASGAFGVPWMVCTNAKGETESFWGVDHLGQVAEFLELDRPLGNRAGEGGSGGWRAAL